MSRPTIASLTAQVEHERNRVRAAEDSAAMARAGQRDAEKSIDSAKQMIADLEHRLSEAQYAAAYWLGRAHQAVGIPEDQQGVLITDLVARTTAPQRDQWGNFR